MSIQFYIIIEIDDFIVDDNDGKDEESDDDIIDTGNRFSNFIFQRKRPLARFSRPESMTTPKKMSRLYSRNKNNSTKTNVENKNIKDESDDILNSILNDIDRKRSEKKYSSHKKDM